MKFFILNWKKRENENFSIIGNRLQNDGSVNSIRPNCSLGLSYRSRSLLLTFGRSGSSNLDGKFPPFQWNAKNPIVSVTVAITTNRKNVLKGPMKGMILKRDNLTCAVLWVFVNSSLEYNYGGTVPASLIFFLYFWGRVEVWSTITSSTIDWWRRNPPQYFRFQISYLFK